MKTIYISICCAVLSVCFLSGCNKGLVKKDTEGVMHYLIDQGIAENETVTFKTFYKKDSLVYREAESQYIGVSSKGRAWLADTSNNILPHIGGTIDISVEKYKKSPVYSDIQIYIKFIKGKNKEAWNKQLVATFQSKLIAKVQVEYKNVLMKNNPNISANASSMESVAAENAAEELISSLVDTVNSQDWIISGSEALIRFVLAMKHEYDTMLDVKNKEIHQALLLYFAKADWTSFEDLNQEWIKNKYNIGKK